MKRQIALAAVSVLTVATPAWATVVDLGSQPSLAAPAVPVTAPAVPATTPATPKRPAPAPVSREEGIRRQCAVARYRHDQLYKAGVPDADEQVNVRAACEPDKIEAESRGRWILFALLVAGIAIFFPLLLMGMAPG